MLCTLLSAWSTGWGFVREVSTDLKDDCGGVPVFVGWQVLARTAARSRARRTRRTVFPP